MFHVRLLTAAIVFYGLAHGMLITATPQVALSLGWSSKSLGLIGAGTPLGYALGCLACGCFVRAQSKHLLHFGVGMAFLSMVGCFFARTPGWAVAAQVCLGFANGFFFPVVASWLLEFQRDGIARTSLLRHYNVAWTAGTAAGMYATGWLCDAGWIFPSYLIGAGFMAACFLVALIPESRGPGSPSEAPPPHPLPPSEEIPQQPVLQRTASNETAAQAAASRRRVPFAILAAALMASLLALAMRSTVLVNYPELNKALGGSAKQMGSLSALVLVGQLAAFGIGALYEPFIGLRRTYVVSAVMVIATGLAFAYLSSPAALVPMALLTGVTMAMAFQAGIVASTGYFAQARTGTTFFEFIVGTGGLYSFAGGALVDASRGWGFGEIEALRMPFLATASLVVLALILQCLLVSRRADHRILLPETRG